MGNLQEEREEARRQRNEKVPFDWRIVKCNQTDYCGAEWLAEHHVKECGVYYLFDANRHVHICSFTPSAELWPMNAYAIPVDDIELTDEQNEAIGEVELEIMNSEEACSYTDMRDAVRWPHEKVTNLDEDSYCAPCCDILGVPFR